MIFTKIWILLIFAKRQNFSLRTAVDEKSSIIDFLVKHQMSAVANYSNINCDNKILNYESTEAIKNKKNTKRQYRQR